MFCGFCNRHNCGFSPPDERKSTRKKCGLLRPIFFPWPLLTVVVTPRSLKNQKVVCWYRFFVCLFLLCTFDSAWWIIGIPFLIIEFSAKYRRPESHESVSFEVLAIFIYNSEVVSPAPIPTFFWNMDINLQTLPCIYQHFVQNIVQRTKMYT